MSRGMLMPPAGQVQGSQLGRGAQAGRAAGAGWKSPYTSSLVYWMPPTILAMTLYSQAPIRVKMKPNTA